jgi:hypothetical protein
MADFDSKLPIRSLAADNTTEIADSAGATINPAKEDGNLLSIKNQTDNLTFTATRLLVDGSGVTQPVSGPLTDTQLRATPVPVSGTVAVTQSTSPWAISAASLPLPTGAATEATLAALDAKFNSLGQKTMANSAPVVIASDQSAIPVTFTPTATVELPQYNTAPSIAANASSTQTYSPASTVSLDGVDASASGQMKIEIQWGTTGSETTKVVLFTSKGDLRTNWRLPYPVTITNTMSVKVIRTNMDNQSMDVYSTILVH